MAASATARCSELERKLVHLSVAIEDKSESIDLLVQAIQEAEVKLEHQYQVCNAELRPPCIEIYSVQVHRGEEPQP